MYMIMFVSKNPEQASDVLDLWVKAGIQGVTILESAGMQQAAGRGFRDDIGITFSLSALLRAQEIHHRTLFSAIRDEETLKRVVRVTTEYVGDWSSPEVGVLFVWPLAEAYGLDKRA
jgi:nitrogen regulatory protein PII